MLIEQPLLPQSSRNILIQNRSPNSHIYSAFNLSLLQIPQCRTPKTRNQLYALGQAHLHPQPSSRTCPFVPELRIRILRYLLVDDVPLSFSRLSSPSRRKKNKIGNSRIAIFSNKKRKGIPNPKISISNKELSSQLVILAQVSRQTRLEARDILFRSQQLDLRCIPPLRCARRAQCVSRPSTFTVSLEQRRVSAAARCTSTEFGS